MTNALFLRDFRISISNDGVETSIEHARICFNITKSLIAKENTSYIDIYNIGKETRALTAQDNSILSLHAGYINGNLSQVILGDITDVLIARDTTEVVTRLQVVEGNRKLQYSRLIINLDK